QGRLAPRVLPAAPAPGAGARGSQLANSANSAKASGPADAGGVGGASPASPARPLAGVKILDFGWVVAGPAATRVLGLLGATVVKVESNTHLDSTRASTPFFGRPSRDRSGMFAQHNNNKLSLSLD